MRSWIFSHFLSFLSKKLWKCSCWNQMKKLLLWIIYKYIIIFVVLTSLHLANVYGKEIPQCFFFKLERCNDKYSTWVKFAAIWVLDSFNVKSLGLGRFWRHWYWFNQVFLAEAYERLWKIRQEIDRILSSVQNQRGAEFDPPWISWRRC